MGSLLVPILIFGAMFFVVLIIGRKFTGEEAEAKHREKMLGSIAESGGGSYASASSTTASILKDDSGASHKWVLMLPRGEAMYELAMKANMIPALPVIILGGIVLAFVVFNAVGAFVGNKLLGALIGAAVGIMLPRWVLRRKITKRNEAFINMFPDAVDMIVRSVKSGHPLNTALKMIAENMDDPVRSEFQKLVEEISFGRTNTEALVRMSYRIDEPDLHFFVVILSVQQETGGNLAEVLSNLSNIIRKRKQLRLKIKAMTSEGRATALILGSLPIVVFGAIYFTSPDYAKIMFETEPGRIIFSIALGLIGLCMFVVNRMIKIDI